jgi:hypothetical protein
LIEELVTQAGIEGGMAFARSSPQIRAEPDGKLATQAVGILEINGGAGVVLEASGPGMEIGEAAIGRQGEQRRGGAAGLCWPGQKNMRREKAESLSS